VPAAPVSITVALELSEGLLLSNVGSGGNKVVDCGEIFGGRLQANHASKERFKKYIVTGD
jgi:hypothetical protein